METLRRHGLLLRCVSAAAISGNETRDDAARLNAYRPISPLGHCATKQEHSASSSSDLLLRTPPIGLPAAPRGRPRVPARASEERLVLAALQILFERCPGCAGRRRRGRSRAPPANAPRRARRFLHSSPPRDCDRKQVRTPCRGARGRRQRSRRRGNGHASRVASGRAE